MIDMSFYEFNRQFYEPRDYNKGKKMNEAATMEFKSEGVESSKAMKALLDSVEVTERHQGREREVVAPGDVGAATHFQTDADINP